jgi:nucleoside-diphosphate-sugar epimerase
MLGLAKRLKIKILQTSTSEVYGGPEIHPQPESYRGNVNPIGQELVMMKVKDPCFLFLSHSDGYHLDSTSFS